MISDVRKIFDDYLTKKFKTNQSILNFFMKHERKEICLNNLCAEIMAIENRRLDFNAYTYVELIEAVAKMFCERSLTVQDQKLMSTNERRRLEDENRRLEIAKETIQEFEGGVYKGILDDETPAQVQ